MILVFFDREKQKIYVSDGSSKEYSYKDIGLLNMLLKNKDDIIYSTSFMETDGNSVLDVINQCFKIDSPNLKQDKYYIRSLLPNTYIYQDKECKVIFSGKSDLKLVSSLPENFLLKENIKELLNNKSLELITESEKNKISTKTQKRNRIPEKPNSIVIDSHTSVNKSDSSDSDQDNISIEV